MSKYLKISIDQTAVAISTPVALNKTPLLGSGSRAMRLRIPVLPGATGAPSTKLQTAPRVDSTTGAAPASGSSLWTDLVTLTSASEHEYTITPDYWIRANTTVAHAADPLVVCYLEGIQ